MSDYIITEGDELCHYGVKGMKWGVRRAVNRDSAVKAAKKQYSKDFDDAWEAARKTKSFAITKRGKEKKARLDADYEKKYEKASKSYDNYMATREKTAKKIQNSKQYKDKQAKKVANRKKAVSIVNKSANMSLAAASRYAQNKSAIESANAFVTGDYGTALYKYSMSTKYADIGSRAQDRYKNA